MPAIVGPLLLLVFLALLFWIGWIVFRHPGPADKLTLCLHRTCTLALPGTQQLLTVTANGDGIENNISVVSSDETIATVSPGADAHLFIVNYLAVGHVTFSGTATNSAGQSISGSVDADVTQPAADALTLTLSDI